MPCQQAGVCGRHDLLSGYYKGAVLNGFWFQWLLSVLIRAKKGEISWNIRLFFVKEKVCVSYRVKKTADAAVKAVLGINHVGKHVL